MQQNYISLILFHTLLSFSGAHCTAYNREGREQVAGADAVGAVVEGQTERAMRAGAPATLTRKLDP